MATIEQVNARIQQISTAFNSMDKQMKEMNIEYNQLLGYKQALLDAQPPEEFEQKEAADLFDKPGLLEG